MPITHPGDKGVWGIWWHPDNIPSSSRKPHSIAKTVRWHYNAVDHNLNIYSSYLL